MKEVKFIAMLTPEDRSALKETYSILSCNITNRF